MENTKKNSGFGKIVNFWIPQYQDFDTKRPNIFQKNGAKTALVTLYREGDAELKVYVMVKWIRELNKNSELAERILSIGINENYDYKTPELNPDPATDGINDKYLSISGELLVKLFENKGLKKIQENLYGDFVPKPKSVLQSLKTMLNLTDDQIKPFINKDGKEELPVNKPEPTVIPTVIDSDAEKLAAEQLAKINDSDDELNF